MDGSGAEPPATRVWRMSAARRAQFLVIALLAVGIGVVIGGGAIFYPGYAVIGVMVIIAMCAGAAWAALQLRDSLTLTGTALIVRTAAKTHVIPFQQIDHASAGRVGIFIWTSDGSKVMSRVAENSDWSQRFGLKTKADGIADAINNAIGADRPQEAPVPAAAVPDHVQAVPDHASAVPDHVPVVTGEVAPPPGHAPAGREDGQSQGSVWIMVLLLVAGAFLLIGGISNLVRARRQLPSGAHVIPLLRTHRPAL